MIVFDKFFQMMKDRGCTSYQIRKKAIIGTYAFENMRTGKGTINTKTVDRICKEFGCQPGDIMEYIPDPENKTE